MSKSVDIEQTIRDLTGMKRSYDAISLDAIIKHLEELPTESYCWR